MVKHWREQTMEDLAAFTAPRWAELEAHELERTLERDLALPTRTGLWQHLSLGIHRSPAPQMWHFIGRRSTLLPVCVEEDRTGLVYRASTWRKRKTFPPFTEATTCATCWRTVLAEKR